jgi:hypothetical protein
MTEPRSIPSQRDPDLANAEVALKRAARQVRERARRTGTALAYVQDGKLKIERPSDGPDGESKMDAGR